MTTAFAILCPSGYFAHPHCFFTSILYLLEGDRRAAKGTNNIKMRCLSCWKTIDDRVAVYTKSCQHVFCTTCSDAAFKKDLSCPLCDTVLPKSGTAQMIIKPDEAAISNAASTMFGFEPQQMCETFQMAVHFWTAQKQNESIKHAQNTANLRAKLEEAHAQNAKLLKVRHFSVR